MKKLILLLLFGFLAFSCSSDSSSGPALSDTPSAKSEYDANNYGIYKGVVIGSSGTVLININNEGFLSATLTIDGATSTYSSTETAILNSNTEGLTFTNGSNSFDFNVDSDGSNPTISNISISGHANARMTVLKEFHNALAKCYEGSFNGDDAGLFHVVIVENVVDGIGKSNEAESPIFNVDGIVNGNNMTGTFEGGSFTGTINGNGISGTWQNLASESGSWSGTRKL